jgi:hypothetical protein
MLLQRQLVDHAQISVLPWSRMLLLLLLTLMVKVCAHKGELPAIILALQPT